MNLHRMIWLQKIDRQRHQQRRTLSAGKAAIAWAILLTGVALMVGCEDDREVFDFYDHDELVRYIHEDATGLEFFRTAGLIPSDPYTKPFDEGAVYRDFVDSIDRWYDVFPTPDSVDKDFGSPLWIVDDAEMIVEDLFFVRIQRIAGTDTSYVNQGRLLRRLGYFLRLGSENQRFSGWKLHGFNGGAPGSGTLMEVTKEDGTTFRGDNIGFDEFRYVQYITIRYQTENGQWAIRTDTLVRYSRWAYRPLEDIAVVTKGRRLVFTSSFVRDNSVYQLMTADTNSGSTLQVMHGPQNAGYVDTVFTPAVNPRVWNLVFVQEFKATDRPGDIWCVSYRSR